MVVGRIEEIRALEFPQVKALPMRNVLRERLVHDGPFRLDPAELLGLPNKIRIEFDIRSHKLAPLDVYESVYSSAERNSSTVDSLAE